MKKIVILGISIISMICGLAMFYFAFFKSYPIGEKQSIFIKYEAEKDSLTNDTYIDYTIVDVIGELSSNIAYLGDDVVLKVKANVKLPDLIVGDLYLTLNANNIDVKPEGKQIISLTNENYTEFVLSPKSTGSKKISISSALIPDSISSDSTFELEMVNVKRKDFPEQRRILDLAVKEKFNFGGLSNQIILLFSSILTLFGTPSIIEFINYVKGSKMKKGGT